eukprot:m51a1_g3691 putative ankyrin repeat-containing protein (731) ;mRNA; f:350527-353786
MSQRSLFGSRRAPRGLMPMMIDKRFTAIHVAIATKNREELLKALKKRGARADLGQPDSQDRVPLVMAVQEFPAAVTDILEFYEKNNIDINHQDTSGNTVLHVACQEPQLEERVLASLLNFKGINVSAKNMDANTPLHYFCERFSSPACQDLLELFKRRGANFNEANTFGETPLHKACLNNSIRIMLVNYLIEQGADVNKLNVRHEGPLHFAVRMNREDLVMILLKAGADISVRDQRENKTPLELARHKRIQNRLRSVEELYRWLDELDPTVSLHELYGAKFCAEEMFLDVLPEVTDELLEKIGVDKQGHRITILNSAKRIERLRQSSASGSGSSVANGSSIERKSTLGGTGSSGPPVPLESNWVISPADVEFTAKAGSANKGRIGSGTSGKVYRAIFKGKEDIAVKILKPLDSAEQVDEFKKEFDIMCAVQNPYIVHFYGAILEPKLSLVMEFCERDTLFEVMCNDTLDIGWSSFVRWTRQFTTAIKCLHDHKPQQVLHRDFKSLNILMTRDWDCRVCDFGLSRFNSETNRMGTLTQMRGTLTHMAPEVCPLDPDVAPTPYTIKCDVYSMGIVIWEIVKRCVDGVYSKPWFSEPGLSLTANPASIEIMLMMKAQQGQRPTLEPSARGAPTPGRPPQIVVDLYRSCVDADPAARPDCEGILARLDAIAAAREAAPEEWEACRVVRPNLTSTEPPAVSAGKHRSLMLSPSSAMSLSPASPSPLQRAASPPSK